MSERTIVRPDEARLALDQEQYVDDQDRTVAEYAIEVAGNPIGHAILEYKDDEQELCISSIILDDDKKGEGYGKEAYKDIARLGHDVGLTFTSGDMLVSDSKGMWESFVYDDVAVQREDGRYVMLPIDPYDDYWERHE